MRASVSSMKTGLSFLQLECGHLDELKLVLVLTLHPTFQLSQKSIFPKHRVKSSCLTVTTVLLLFPHKVQVQSYMCSCDEWSEQSISGVDMLAETCLYHKDKILVRM